MDSDQLLNELNRLQRRLYDSFREFNTTQDNLKDDELITFFYQQALQRKEYYKAIRNIIKQLGEIPKNVVSPFSDAADEIFTDLKSIFTNEDNKMILREAVLKEELLLRAYHQVLEVEEVINDDLKAVLNEQQEEVKRDLAYLQEALNRFS